MAAATGALPSGYDGALALALALDLDALGASLFFFGATEATKVGDAADLALLPNVSRAGGADDVTTPR